MSDLILSFVLGLIQGLTEFLPVSSSAHLLFPSLIFGSNDLGLAFDVAAHAGTLCAVIYFFKLELINMTKSFFTSSSLLKEERKLALLLILATLPIVIFGFLASDLVQLNRANISSIAWMNLIFAGLLLLAYKLNPNNKDLIQLTVLGAIFIGSISGFCFIAWCLKIWNSYNSSTIYWSEFKRCFKIFFHACNTNDIGSISFFSFRFDVFRTNY